MGQKTTMVLTLPESADRVEVARAVAGWLKDHDFEWNDGSHLGMPPLWADFGPLATGLCIEADFDHQGNLVLSGFIVGSVWEPDNTKPLGFDSAGEAAWDAVRIMPAAQQLRGMGSYGALVEFAQDAFATEGRVVGLDDADRARAAGVLTPIVDQSAEGRAERERRVAKNETMGRGGHALSIVLLVAAVALSLVGLAGASLAVVIPLLVVFGASAYNIYVAARGGDSSATREGRAGATISVIAMVVAFLGLAACLFAGILASA